VIYRKLDSDDPFKILIPERTDNYSFIGNLGTLFYFHTNYKAPNGRIITIDLLRPEEENWKEIIAEQPAVISTVKMTNKALIVNVLENVSSKLKIFNLSGKILDSIHFDNFISITNISVKKNDIEMFFDCSSYQSPTVIKRFDLDTFNMETIFDKKEINNALDTETRQIFCTSKDNVKIPFFITYKKGVEFNGNNPIVLYGYGGYNLNMTPNHSFARNILLEYGGIYVEANLRGANEYGEGWH